MKEIKTHNTSSQEICSGNWIALNKINYINKHGKAKVWECASRVNSRGAAMMIAVLRPSDRVILVRQFRPPLDGPVIEFPAGLIDPGEAPEVTAVRELLEETGYDGRVVKILPQSCSSPGLTGEKTSIILMEIDDADYSTPPHPTLEDDEEIQTLLVPRSELLDYLLEAEKNGHHIDSKLMVYAMCNAGEFDF